MNSPSAKWLDEGTGQVPEIAWSFVTDAPLQTLDYASEAGTLLVADQSGGMYLFDRAGKLTTMMRGFQEVRDVALADRGSGAIAIIGENRIVSMTPALNIEWSNEVTESVTTVAAAPFGEHFAVCLANGLNYILRSDRKRISKFETERPIRFVRFLHTQTELIMAAEYGLIARHDLRGHMIWKDKIYSNVGELAVTADGRMLAMAMFSHGVQKYSGDGESAGRFMVEGTPHKIAMSESGHRIAISTLEQHLYWIDADGNLLWAAHAPETIQKLMIAPVGETLFVALQNGRVLSLRWPN